MIILMIDQANWIKINEKIKLEKEGFFKCFIAKTIGEIRAILQA